MKEENVIKDKSFDFAVRIVGLFKFIQQEKNEYIMSKQVFRSGTSIGANVCEAVQAFSKADFVAKMSIALKETSETDYWLRLLHKTDYLENKQFNSIHNDCQELIKLLTSIINKTRTSLNY